MPRYDDRDRYGGDRHGGGGDRHGGGSDRHGGTRLYVGHLSSRTRSGDLDRLFSRYGRVRNVDMKSEFAFVEFSDPRDADDARYSLNGRDVDGNRIAVDFAKGVPRGAGSSGSRDREYMGKGPPPGSGRCFNCGLDGHWARDCKAGDWKNKCYRCGDRGHVERNCQNSPKKISRGRSYSRSPVRSRSPRRGRSRSYSGGRSYSRSKSPVKRERSVEHKKKRSRSPVRERKSSPPLKVRRHSPSPDEGGSPKERGSPPPKINSYNGSPKEKTQSPGGSPEIDHNSPEPVKPESPSEANGASPTRKSKYQYDSPDSEPEEDNRPSPNGTPSESE